MRRRIGFDRLESRRPLSGGGGGQDLDDWDEDPSVNASDAVVGLPTAPALVAPGSAAAAGLPIGGALNNGPSGGD